MEKVLSCPLLYDFFIQVLSDPGFFPMLLLAGLVAWALYLFANQKKGPKEK